MTTPQFKEGMFHEAWSSFQANVIPEKASIYQRYAIRQAYLSGACAYRQGMAASFLNDSVDGRALENLGSIDAELDALSIEYLADASRIEAEAVTTLTGVKEPHDAPMQTHLHVVEARGLSMAEVAELNGLIQAFIADKTANRSDN